MSRKKLSERLILSDVSTKYFLYIQPLSNQDPPELAVVSVGLAFAMDILSMALSNLAPLEGP